MDQYFESRSNNFKNVPIVGAKPESVNYDVIIIGGATMGACTAWFLASNPDFKGRVLIIEKDMSFEKSQSAASNNCMRQQFANPINVQIGLFAADFVKNFRENLGGSPEVPELFVRNFGYLYLSDNSALTEVLQRDQKVQAEAGAGTRMVSSEEIAKAYPFYKLDDIEAGSLNTENEGYYNAPLMVEWLIRKSIECGVEYIQNEVASIQRDGDSIAGVTLATGEKISAGSVVNASGTRAGKVAELAGLELEIQPRRRYTYIFKAEKPPQ